VVPDNVRMCRTMFGQAGQCPAKTFCGGWRLSRVGPHNIQLGVSVWDSFGKDLESLDLIIFTSSTRPFFHQECIRDLLVHLMNCNTGIWQIRGNYSGTAYHALQL
jgi:hypothetical protein